MKLTTRSKQAIWLEFEGGFYDFIHGIENAGPQPEGQQHHMQIMCEADALEFVQD